MQIEPKMYAVSVHGYG